MPSRTSSTPRRNSKSTKPSPIVWLVLALLVAALMSVVVYMTRSTDSRSQAVAVSKYPVTAYTTSAPVSGATSPSLAVDGNAGTLWNAGAFPRRWIAVNLNSVKQIGQIRLVIAQSPAGATTHKVYVSTTPPTDTNLGTLVYTFSGNTSDSQTLLQNITPINGQYVTVETTQSPSYVAWREIEIYPPDTTQPSPSPVVAESRYQLTAQATSTAVTGATNPSLSIDGNAGTLWNAGAFPTRWIAYNLNQTGQVSRIKLNPAQSPAGATTHKIYVSANPPTQGNYGTLVHTFSGSTSDGQILEKVFSPALNNVRYVTIETTQSPSYVAWREVEIYRPGSGGAGTPAPTVVPTPVATPVPSPVSSAPPRTGYTLVFNDEFDCPMVDNVDSACRTNFYNKWNTRYVYDGGRLDYLNPDIEIERYRDNGNHVISNGTLKLIANRTAAFNPANIRNPIYESGMIRSKQAFQGRHYMEARIKIPNSQAQFSAFWMNPQGGAWPPELDIMESWNVYYTFHDAKNGPLTPVRTYVNTGASARTEGPNAVVYQPSGVNFSSAFHVYAMEWNNNTYTIYVDGTRIGEWQFPFNDRNGQPAGPADIILNFAMLNNQPASAYTATQLTYEADYVRVYQKN